MKNSTKKFIKNDWKYLWKNHRWAPITLFGVIALFIALFTIAIVQYVS